MPNRAPAPILLGLLALALGACVQAVAEHPQVTHCKNALAWVVERGDVVQIMGTQRSTGEEAGARVALDVRVNGEAVGMTCLYAGAGGVSRGGRRASSITYDGETLNDAQLEQINDAVRSNRNPLQNLRRAI